MLEGLEISELRLSELENQFTIGSEFYSKEYVEIVNQIKRATVKYDTLSNVTTLITDGDHGATKYVDDGILYLLSESIKDGYLDTNVGTRYISTALNKELKRSELHPGDIVVTKTGVYFGKSAVIPNEIKIANTSAHVAKISPNNDINPYYLSTFFNSGMGYSQLRRRGIKVSRPEIKLIEFQDILISLPSKIFQNSIEQIVVNAQNAISNSKISFQKGESILLKEIGMESFELSKAPVNIKNFKESFGVTKRLDAEYYQKKYEEVIEKIVSQKHDVLSKIVHIAKSIEPGSNHYSDERGLPYYRVSDYNKFGLSKPDKELSKSFVTENQNLIENLKPKKGTILFSKDGSVGVAYLLRNDLDGITSGAVLHLQIKNPKEIIPEYLTLVLNSKLVQMQAERDAGGSIILHWRKEEIEQVVVPIIDFKKQQQIAELVEESFKLKAESEQLLEVAKKAVEMAIEENEEVAMKFIKENIN